MNNPETHVLTHNRFNTYMVLIFTDLKKAQIYKTPHKNSPHKGIEIVTKFDYLHLLRPFGIEKVTHFRIETNENFLFKIGDKKYIYVGDKISTFETVDDIDEYFSECKGNDIKYPFGLSDKNIYFMLYEKFLTIKEYEIESKELIDEYEYLYNKNKELKGGNDDDGIVEYGNDFLNCKIIHGKTLKNTLIQTDI